MLCTGNKKPNNYCQTYYKMAKALNSEFKPKLVAVIRGFDSDLLNELQYPICLQPLHKGVDIVIRSGFMRIVPDIPIKNINLKGKLAILLAETRRLKITLEATITSKISNSPEHIVPKLLSVEADVSDFEVTVNDMVFEHCPDAINYKVRAKDMHVLFRKDKVGQFPKFAENVTINTRKELADQMNYFAVVGYSKFRLASPNSKYKFGELTDLFSEEGGVIDVDGVTKFKGTVLSIEPKLISVKGSVNHVADTLKIQYQNVVTDLKLENLGILTTSKIWENRDRLINSPVIFTGLLLPTYSYPKFRTFVRFEKQ